ncbi:hypothetical protein Skr01_15780 [Sphaerisporangium krabiense]|uniref:DNA-binding protein YbaB n=1 Tax=Sphaerisporangium krabiense TaxID=763782 RepID=A0A7W8YZ98_9ACTN|nr:YbaB/EbfC family nucleoid-associated protein [Sphaerisporangium krabiense]MBB5624552.1 DNA-binding protein YbaB [Sphaerisporangium krabiense]GII61493.1 hypothetical protein Skr01_15780 [Sphaerisporangium krabiense]
MSSPSPTPWTDDLEHLELIVRGAEDALRGLMEAQDEIARVTGEGEGADGLMSVAADGRGRLTSVRFDPRVMRLSPEELGREALAAISRAQDAAGRRARDIAARAAERAAPLPEALDERFVRQRVERIAREAG